MRVGRGSVCSVPTQREMMSRILQDRQRAWPSGPRWLMHLQGLQPQHELRTTVGVLDVAVQGRISLGQPTGIHFSHIREH
jgi:hypothetical protein